MSKYKTQELSGELLDRAVLKAAPHILFDHDTPMPSEHAEDAIFLASRLGIEVKPNWLFLDPSGWRAQFTNPDTAIEAYQKYTDFNGLRRGIGRTGDPSRWAQYGDFCEAICRVAIVNVFGAEIDL